MVEISEDTKLSQLIKEYPWLKDELAMINKKFKMLKSPIGKVMMRKATIHDMSAKSGMDTQELINRINGLIENHEK